MAKRRGRGEGSVEELPSGKFRAVVSDGVETDPVTGKPKRRKVAFTADTKTEVLKWLRDRLQEKDAGQLAHCGRTTVGQWLDEWLADLKSKNSVQPGTLAFYEGNVRRHLKPTLGG